MDNIMNSSINLLKGSLKKSSESLTISSKDSFWKWLQRLPRIPSKAFFKNYLRKIFWKYEWMSLSSRLLAGGWSIFDFLKDYLRNLPRIFFFRNFFRYWFINFWIDLFRKILQRFLQSSTMFNIFLQKFLKTNNWKV